MSSANQQHSFEPRFRNNLLNTPKYQVFMNFSQDFYKARAL